MIEELFSSKIKGLREALLYGISEAQYLGKKFIGITLSNGDGLIIYLDPYQEAVKNLLYITNKNLYIGKFIGVFRYYEGNTYKIYQINLEELNEITSSKELWVVSVEVIKDVLEDFLVEAVDQ
jgi:hypothetical protein